LNHLHNYDDYYYSPHWMKPACIVQLFKITCIKKHYQENKLIIYSSGGLVDTSAGCSLLQYNDGRNTDKLGEFENS
ncbi:hypothetical protein T06_11940, partial [Trichinella sp. T6]